MSATPLREDAPSEGRSAAATAGWVVVLVIAAFLFAYSAWTAVQNLIAVPPLITRNYDFYRENKLDGLIKPVPWVQLISAVAAPIVGFVVAVLVGRRRPTWQRVLLLVTSFAAVSAVAASVSAYVSAHYGL